MAMCSAVTKDAFIKKQMFFSELFICFLIYPLFIWLNQTDNYD